MNLDPRHIPVLEPLGGNGYLIDAGGHAGDVEEPFSIAFQGAGRFVVLIAQNHLRSRNDGPRGVLHRTGDRG